MAAHAASISGEWESNHGPVSFTNKGNDAYSVVFKLIKGQIVGTLKGDVLEGTWVRPDGGEPCATEKEGSPHWGGFKITFYPDVGFQGYFHFCDEKSRVMNFTGARPK